MTTLLYLMACLMSPAPLINLAESRVQEEQENQIVITPPQSGGLDGCEQP